MRKDKELVDIKNVNYDPKLLAPIEDVIFLDIETTGLSSRNSFIYMIGLMYYSNNAMEYVSLCADNAADEKIIISEFISIVQNYKAFIHFYGNNFDLPFLADRIKANGLSFDLKALESIDLFRKLSPLKKLFKLTNCKLKTIEHFLGIDRLDEYSGGELIEVYREYSSLTDDDFNHREELYKLLYQHNRDDVIDMLGVLKAFEYLDYYNCDVSIIDSTENKYCDYYGKEHSELIITYKASSSLMTKISLSKHDCYCIISENKGTLKVPIYSEELKYFYDNYKDYYYLPEEDMAIHKSVADYVDKNYRKKATANNCYRRHSSRFLPEWDNIVTPAFKRDYDSKELFFEYTDEIVNNKALLELYIKHILHVLTQ